MALRIFSHPPFRNRFDSTMSTKSITVTTKNGRRRFPSIAAAARAFGLSATAVGKRLNRQGWTPERALGLSPPPKKPPHPKSKAVLVLEGQSRQRFRSINEAAAAYGISPRTLRSRLHQLGWTIPQALGVAPPPQKKLPSNAKQVVVRHNGRCQRYPSIGAAAKAHGLRPALVHKRWRVFGWKLVQALGLEPPPQRRGARSKPVTFVHKGKRYRYPSVQDAAKAHGVNYGTALSRLERLRWTMPQALELVAPSTHKKSCYGFIYVITHRKSGRQYVGQTLLPIAQRWEEHVRTAQDADPEGPHLRSAIRRHGHRAFAIKEVDTTTSFFDANAKERLWIKRLATLSPHGFNITRGGGGINLGRPIKVRGTRYASIADAARAHSLNPLKVASRLRDHGWTVEQSLGIEPPPARESAPKPVMLTMRGKQRRFESIRAAADTLGMDYNTVRQRIYGCGWSVDQAFELAPPPQHKPPRSKQVVFLHGGRHYRYNSLKEASLAHGVKPSLASVRIGKLGWSYAEAFGLARRPRQKGPSRVIEFTHGGKRHRYNSIDQAARLHGLKPPTVSARIRERGWTYAQALGLDRPPDQKPRSDCSVSFLHHGRKYSYASVSDAAKEHLLKPGTVNARIRSGYSIQQALGLATAPIRGRWVYAKKHRVPR